MKLKRRTSRNSQWMAALIAFISAYAISICDAGSSTGGSSSKGSFSYVGGKSKDLQASFTSPSGAVAAVSPAASSMSSHHSPMTGSASSSLAATSYYEPRGDYSGGGGGGGGGYAGGGFGGGGIGGGGAGGGWGGPSVYHYQLHQPQPYYPPAPVYYDDGGGFDGSEKGLLGLLGLGGLKGLLGLLGLAKLLLPLLALFIPLLLPLLLLKAAALLALILLIPVPVITTGRRMPTSIEEGKTYLKETVAELLARMPTDMNQIISKIKDSEMLKPKEMKAAKSSIDKSNGSKSR